MHRQTPRGKYKRPPPSQEKATARYLVRTVRALWLTHHQKKQRRRDNGISAVQIVARYLGESSKNIDNWMKETSGP